jgi:RecB family exonuclease
MKLSNHSISLKPLGFEFGNAVHNALHKVLLQRPIFDEECNKLIKKTLFDELTSDNASNPFLNYERELFNSKIDKFVKYEKTRFDDGYRIFGLELEYFAQYNGININGKIDRIDMNDGAFTILDYKTSSSLKVDTIRNYENSSDFQLEFYYLLLSHNIKDKNGSKIKQVGYYDLTHTKILIEDMLEEKLELLYKIFDELKTEKVDFELCEKVSSCQFCDYKILCGRR